jgi:hypothetical protein
MTWNRLDALRAALDASPAQSERESELIMADNDSRA